MAGWRTPYSFLGTPLVAEGAERVLPRLLWEVPRGRRAGVTMLDQISRESVAWQAIEDGVGRGDLVALAGVTSTVPPSCPRAPRRSCR